MAMVLINESLDFETIKAICTYLKNGYAVLIKTDTQWGIMALKQPIIYEIKRRPLNKKLIRFVGMNFRFNDLSIQQRKFIAKFWPGSVTIIKNGESFRLTNRRIINAILAMIGQPLYCSSANIAGGDPIQSIDEALTVFSHAANKIVGLVPIHDYKEREWENNLPSTIVDIDYWYIVRKGSRYEEVLDYIANTIIPSYDKQKQIIENNIKKRVFKVPLKYTRNYYGIPVIDIVPGLAQHVRHKNIKKLIREYQLEEQREQLLKQQSQQQALENQKVQNTKQKANKDKKKKSKNIDNKTSKK